MFQTWLTKVVLTVQNEESLGMKLFPGMAVIHILAPVIMIATHMQTCSQKATYRSGTQRSFTKECDIPSQGPKSQYVPNLAQVCDPYWMEGREIGHNDISMNEFSTQINSGVVMIAIHIQTCSQTSTSPQDQKVTS